MEMPARLCVPSALAVLLNQHAGPTSKQMQFSCWFQQDSHQCSSVLGLSFHDMQSGDILTPGNCLRSTKACIQLTDIGIMPPVAGSILGFQGAYSLLAASLFPEVDMLTGCCSLQHTGNSGAQCVVSFLAGAGRQEHVLGRGARLPGRAVSRCPQLPALWSLRSPSCSIPWCACFKPCPFSPPEHTCCA